MSCETETYWGDYVGKVVTVCGIRDPEATLRLLVLEQHESIVVGAPVDKQNVRLLERKKEISMWEYYLLRVEDAV